MLTPEQVSFFDVFGFLVLRQLSPRTRWPSSTASSKR